MKKEGIYRELLRNCQVIRKEAGFEVSDRVLISIKTNSELLNNVIKEYSQDIEKEALATLKDDINPTYSKNITIDTDSLEILISK